MLGKQFDNVFHYLAALFNMSHLATTEQDGYLHLVVVLEKTNGLLYLKLNIVLARFRPDTNLFQLRLMLFTFGSPLALVIFELSKVHNATNGWFCFGRDFDQIKSVFTRFGKRVGC